MFKLIGKIWHHSINHVRTWVLLVWRTFIWKEHLLPEDEVLRIRKSIRQVFKGSDVLVPLHYIFATKGYSGQNSLLGELLGKECALGRWAIDQRGVDFLWDMLMKLNPKAIVEFGSGVSTLVIACWIAHHAKGKCSFVSVEQDALEKERTYERLTDKGLQDYVDIVHLPVDKLGKYCQNEQKRKEVFESAKFDLVFVDGPSGPPGCRMQTLPMVLPFCRDKGVWILHDAIRDEEIDIVQQWSSLPGVVFKGFYMLGQGIGIGKWQA